MSVSKRAAGKAERDNFPPQGFTVVFYVHILCVWSLWGLRGFIFISGTLKVHFTVTVTNLLQTS